MDDAAAALRNIIGRTVRLHLARRLIAVALLASLLGIVVVVVRARDQYRELLVARAIESTRAVEAMAVEHLERQGSIDWKKDLQPLLERFVARQKIGGDEEIVLAQIIDRDKQSLARIATGTLNSKQMETLSEERLNTALVKQIGTSRHGVVSIDNQRFIVVQTPIPYHTGETVGYSRMIYRVMPETLAALWRRVQFTILLLLAIIVGVALLLYPLISELIERLAHSSADLLDSNLSMLETLGSAIAKRDSDTDAHNYRATLYAIRLGEALGFTPAAMRSLIKGALLHDVGKIGIRDAVLLKPGHLSEEEFREMKRHVTHGLEIVGRAPWLADSATVVGYHHEKFDGSGYDQGLAGESIPLNARIFAVADVFDALTSERPYKAPLSLEETQRVLREGRGTHFAPEIVDKFLQQSEQLYREYAQAQISTLRNALQEKLRQYFRNDAAFILMVNSRNVQ